MVDFVARVREAYPDAGRSRSTPGGPRSGDAVCAAGRRRAQRRLGRRRPRAGRRRGRSTAPRSSAPTPAASPRAPAPTGSSTTTWSPPRSPTRSPTPSGRSPPASTAASVVIDPAHDFGKNTFHSLELTRRLGEMVATGWPVLVSLSNKDFVGETLDLPVGRAADRDPRRDRRLRARRAPGSTACTRSSRPGRPSTWCGRSPAGARRSGRSGGCSDPGGAGAGRARAAARVRRHRGPGRRPAGRVPRRGRLARAPTSRCSPTRRARASPRTCWRRPPRTGDEPSYLVVGNGSARRTEKAPGHLDERAAAFDADLGRCLEQGCRIGRPSTSTWRSELWAERRRDRRAGGRCPDLELAQVDYDDDPYGVQYWVLRWCAGTRGCQS